MAIKRKTQLTDEQKERLRKWVAALRSGDFKQGGGRLKTPNGKYCCLGVACEVSGLGDWFIRDDLILPRIVYQVKNGTQSWSNLPKEVADYYGIQVNPAIADLTTPPVDDDYEIGVYAASANDSLQWNFKKIADAIEKYYEL